MASFSDHDVVIAATARTPIGRAHKGRLLQVRPDDLATLALRAALDNVPQLALTEVEDLYLGCAQPQDEHGQNIARRVAVLLGEDRLPAATVNRFCASSLQAARMAFHAIRAGEGEAYLVGGVECVSRYGNVTEAPHPGFQDAHHRARVQLQESPVWSDPRDEHALPDVYIAMGGTAEFVARRTGTSRRDQDDYALLSQHRAGAAINSGFYARDITPVPLPDGTVMDTDDSPRPATTAEKLATLPAAFVEGGTVTAGNACPLNDGAAAAVLLSGVKARALGITPLARILSTGVSGLSPEIMGLGPVDSSRMALQRAGLRVEDIDIVELNEAFAAQVVPSARTLGIDEERLNPYGGAIALGHPFGATGVRMLGTLIHGLHESDGQFGLATLCVGGGQGMAMVVERL